MTQTTSVFIVGGGLNGLTLAALLAHHGVACTLVERHTHTSIQYKFAGISPRSMEIFRMLGIEDEIRAKRTGDQQGGAIVRGRNLSDPDLHWGGAAWPDASAVSPTQPATCDQHVLEPILQAHASRLGADVRFGTEFLAMKQLPNGVCARIRNLETGAEEAINAAYLVAADSVNGTTRDKLDIGRSGPGVLQHWMNLVFDTDLPSTLDGKRFTSFFTTDLNATLTPREGGRWLLALQYSPDKDERPDDFDVARCRELVAKGAGRDGVKADLVDARSWEVAAFIADKFSSGRCFLVGDAAHVMPPTGGFGGNTGIHDAHNLAWKLALVVRGQANPSLLDTYDAERRYVAANTQAQSLARLRQWFKDLGGKLPNTPAPVEDYDVVFGQRYREGALIAENDGDDTMFAKFKSLSGVPGTRAPHFTVRRDGQQMSSIELFDRDFVLLSGADARWCEAAKRATADTGAPLTCLRFGSDIEALDVRWPDVLGVADDGAVVVRPDGFVAWRAHDSSTNPARALGDALRSIGLRFTSPHLTQRGDSMSQLQ